MSSILVTGGAGYIGSHTCAALVEAGYSLVILDNLSNSKPEALRRLTAITGCEIPFEQADIRDEAALDDVFSRHDISCVIHFAGLKAVGESVAKPLEYYDNNIGGTVTLLRVMKRRGVKTLVFSSSATVYGVPQKLPLEESHPLSCTNPYGWTKLMIEQILRDTCVSDPDFSAVLLRYFNPIGAHVSGTIGEDPEGIPNNICPIITQVAVGKLPMVSVTGNDYGTPDGTGVRDYIHVTDLADGHVAAVDYALSRTGAEAINLGTGRGTSVLELIASMEKAAGRKIPYVFAPRRPGDIAACWASPEKAGERLGWRAKKTLDEMCEDSWRWQESNPRGYEE